MHEATTGGGPAIPEERAADWAALWRLAAHHEREGRRSAEAGIGDCLDAIGRLTAEGEAAERRAGEAEAERDALRAALQNERDLNADMLDEAWAPADLPATYWRKRIAACDAAIRRAARPEWEG